MIKIVGNPVRHKRRIQEMRDRFIQTGEQVEVVYKNTNHILITHENRESKDREDKNES